MRRLEQRRTEMEAPPEKVIVCQREWKRGKGNAHSGDSKVASGSEGPSRSRVQLWGCSLCVRACACVFVCMKGRWGASTCWMNTVSVGQYHGLRVGSSLLSIVAGCILIGVSRDCDADAVGGIFLGAGSLGECVWNCSGTTDPVVGIYLVIVESHWLSKPMS